MMSNHIETMLLVDWVQDNKTPAFSRAGMWTLAWAILDHQILDAPDPIKIVLKTPSLQKEKTIKKAYIKVCLLLWSRAPACEIRFSWTSKLSVWTKVSSYISSSFAANLQWKASNKFLLLFLQQTTSKWRWLWIWEARVDWYLRSIGLMWKPSMSEMVEVTWYKQAVHLV